MRKFVSVWMFIITYLRNYLTNVDEIRRIDSLDSGITHFIIIIITTIIIITVFHHRSGETAGRN